MEPDETAADLDPPLTDAEIRGARALTPEQRLDYFLETALASERLWTLERDGSPLLMRLQDGRPALPVFPRQEFAALEAADASEAPRRLGLEAFSEDGLAAWAGQGVLIGVFPVAGAALVMEALELQTRIWNEWDWED